MLMIFLLLFEKLNGWQFLGELSAHVMQVTASMSCLRGFVLDSEASRRCLRRLVIAALVSLILQNTHNALSAEG